MPHTLNITASMDLQHPADNGLDSDSDQRFVWPCRSAQVQFVLSKWVAECEYGYYEQSIMDAQIEVLDALADAPLSWVK